MSGNEICIGNGVGLSAFFHPNARMKCIEGGGIRVGLRETSAFSRDGNGLYLRLPGEKEELISLTDPRFDPMFCSEDRMMRMKGVFRELDYQACLELSSEKLNWQWTVQWVNHSANPVQLAMVCINDVGLKQSGSQVSNEYYFSQYIERRIFKHPVYGSVVCCRQNMNEKGGYPWLLAACKQGARKAITDGMQFYGNSGRVSGIPEAVRNVLPGGGYAGEHSMLGLFSEEYTIGPGERIHFNFGFSLLTDHPEASSEKDLRLAEVLFDEFKDHHFPAVGKWLKPGYSLFDKATFFPSADPDEQLLSGYYPGERRFAEYNKDQLLSFFTGKGTHVITRAKESLVDRPHGHILQSLQSLVPDETMVFSTVFAYGVFNSHLGQGNTNFNTLLSVCASQFNTWTETGQRIFVEKNGKIWLLGVPTVFEMGQAYARWIYHSEEMDIEVISWSEPKHPQVNTTFRVKRGKPDRILLSHDFDASNAWKVKTGAQSGEYIFMPADKSMIKDKFPEARYRMRIKADGPMMYGGKELLYDPGMEKDESMLIIELRESQHFVLSFLAEVAGMGDFADYAAGENVWNVLVNTMPLIPCRLEMKGGGRDADAIQEIMPWFTGNALIHFLTPYGLEQFSGAAWGTRDVSQGPVDLLMAMEQYDEVRKVLCIIFSNQEPGGGWPQWWMFDSYRSIRADHSHGDVFYWCILALCRYIEGTGDTGILKEVLPYYDSNEKHSNRESLLMHLDRLVKMIKDSFIPGTSLVPYGGGDWNDSLQPVSHELASRMISSWTVEMNFEAFSKLAKIYKQAGENRRSEELGQMAYSIKNDFNTFLVKDGIVAGYGLVEEGGEISVLLHPTDAMTGIRYSLLPMDRGILSGIFTPQQSLYHRKLIETHLKGPDGARLMDRPLRYRGGIQTIFQRAESSTYFGREIGLMYVHEHIRYAETLALTGEAEAFVKALRQAIPVGYNEVVPNAGLRQSNCYYSSSDVSFSSRYEADELYEDVVKGKMVLNGGWRIYSSGPGIFTAMVISRLLGLRLESGHVILDPVMPRSFDGLEAGLVFSGRPVKIKYHVQAGNHSPHKVKAGGKDLVFSYSSNPYRKGGARIEKEEFLRALNKGKGNIEIFL